MTAAVLLGQAALATTADIRAGTDIGALGLGAAALLVLVAVVLSRVQRLELEGTVLTAAARASAQLLVVGGALVLLLAEGVSILWSLLWVAGMIGFAGVTVRNRAPEVDGVLPLAIVAFALTAVVTLGVVFGLRIFPFEARYLVPTAGMMVGNSMKLAVLAARRIVAELADHRLEIEARVALGQPWTDAARPNVRAAVRDAVTPQVETTRGVGLVFLPGAMTGLILAGADPIDAVLVQLAIMFLILGAVAIVTTVIVLGLARRLFTDDDRLVRLPR